MAAVIPGTEDEDMSTRDIVIRRRETLNSNDNEMMEFGSVTNRSYDPLSYVLLFMHGENGRYPKLSFRTEAGASKKISSFMFYARRLLQRPSELTTTPRAGRLSQL